MSHINNDNVLTNIRLFSDYSFGYSASRIVDILDFCKREKIYTVALTDHNNLFGSLDFCLKCYEVVFAQY